MAATVLRQSHWGSHYLSSLPHYSLRSFSDPPVFLPFKKWLNFVSSMLKCFFNKCAPFLLFLRPIWSNSHLARQVYNKRPKEKAVPKLFGWEVVAIQRKSSVHQLIYICDVFLNPWTLVLALHIETLKMFKSWVLATHTLWLFIGSTSKLILLLNNSLYANI